MNWLEKLHLKRLFNYRDYLDKIIVKETERLKKYKKASKKVDQGINNYLKNTVK